MTSHSVWIESHSPFIKAQWQPSLFLDLLMPEHCSHKLLKGSGLFYEDIINDDKEISLVAFSNIIANCQSQYTGQDLAFRLGQIMLPGHYDTISSTLHAASSLLELVSILEALGDRITPGINIKLEMNETEACLRLIHSFGAQQCNVFLTEVYTTAIKSYSQTRSNKKWPWHFDFAHPANKPVELYEMYLGGACRFNQTDTRLRIPLSHLHEQWSSGSQIIFRRGMQHLRPAHGFIRVALDFLEEHVRADCSQDALAQYLNLSVATLKRKLKAHHCSYRILLDQVRFNEAIRLYRDMDMNDGEVAKTLGFFDKANLRRSFKRWAGMNPKQFLGNF
jgi:AraC-like DNA-binding protein